MYMYKIKPPIIYNTRHVSLVAEQRLYGLWPYQLAKHSSGKIIVVVPELSVILESFHKVCNLQNIQWLLNSILQ